MTLNTPNPLPSVHHVQPVLPSPDGRPTPCALETDGDARHPLLYRYPSGDDGLPDDEGAFLPCAFWLVQALAEIGARRRGRAVGSKHYSA